MTPINHQSSYITRYPSITPISPSVPPHPSIWSWSYHLFSSFASGHRKPSSRCFIWSTSSIFAWCHPLLSLCHFHYSFCFLLSPWHPHPSSHSALTTKEWSGFHRARKLLWIESQMAKVARAKIFSERLEVNIRKHHYEPWVVEPPLLNHPSLNLDTFSRARGSVLDSVRGACTVLSIIVHEGSD